MQWLVVTRLTGLASDDAADPASGPSPAPALASLARRLETSAHGERVPRLRRPPTPGRSSKKSAGSSTVPTRLTAAPNLPQALRETRSGMGAIDSGPISSGRSAWRAHLAAFPDSSSDRYAHALVQGPAKYHASADLKGRSWRASFDG